MILGDPYNFAIIIRAIKDWSDDYYKNGLLFFCVDGEIFPKEVINATLNSEIPTLKDNFSNIAVNKDLYEKEKKSAFAEMMGMTYPDNFENDNDYRFDISPLSFSDNHYYIFAVSDGNCVRIMAARIDYDCVKSEFDVGNAQISETFISLVDLQKMIAPIMKEEFFNTVSN